MNYEETYRKDLREKVGRLATWLKLRQKADTEIAKLRRDIGHLSELVGENPKESMRLAMAGLERPEGLTEACRNALLTFEAHAWASEVMEAVLIMGFSPKLRSNLLASIQTTLRRMPDVEEGEKEGKKAYKLVGFGPIPGTK